MHKHSIIIDSSVTSHEREIITDYWNTRRKGKNTPQFVTKPNILAKKYNTSVANLTTLVRHHSSCTIEQGTCMFCRGSMSFKVHSHKDFKANYKKEKYAQHTCSSCQQKQRQMYGKTQEEIAFKNSIFQKFNKAIQEMRWKMLDDEEVEILKGIAQIKDKYKIYIWLSYNYPDNQHIWNKVNKIEKMDLLYVERDKRLEVKEFWFPENIVSILSPENEPIYFQEVEKPTMQEDNKPNKEQNSLRITFSKNTSRSNTRQPDYSGIFKHENSIRIDAGVKYAYAGWINKDGDIFFNIQPLESIVQQIQYYDMEKEPEYIKEIIDRFNQKLLEEFPELC